MGGGYISLRFQVSIFQSEGFGSGIKQSFPLWLSQKLKSTMDSDEAVAAYRIARMTYYDDGYPNSDSYRVYWICRGILKPKIVPNLSRECDRYLKAIVDFDKLGSVYRDHRASIECAAIDDVALNFSKFRAMYYSMRRFLAQR